MIRRTVPVMEKALSPSGGDDDADERSAALRRHPAARAPAHGRGRLIAAVRDQLGAKGVPHPEVAAVVLAERGRRGLDRQEFAQAMHITVERLEQIEAGVCPPEKLPFTLRIKG